MSLERQQYKNSSGINMPIKKVRAAVDVLLTFLWRIATFNPPSQLYSLNLLIFVTM